MKFVNIDMDERNFVTMALRLEPTGRKTPEPIRKGTEGTNEFSAWAYASEGTQLAVILLLGFYVGYRLDKWKGTIPWFTLAGSAVGLLAGLYNFLKRFLKK